MDKGRRNELTQLKFKKRLKNQYRSWYNPPHQYCYKAQSTPCSCSLCSHNKYNRAKAKRVIKNLAA